MPFQLVESLAREAITNGPLLLSHAERHPAQEPGGVNGASIVLPIKDGLGVTAALHLFRAAPAMAFTRVDLETGAMFAALTALAIRLGGTATQTDSRTGDNQVASEPAIMVVDQVGRILGLTDQAALLIASDPDRPEEADLRLLGAKDRDGMPLAHPLSAATFTLPGGPSKRATRWKVHEDPTRPGVFLCVGVPPGLDWEARAQALARELEAWHAISQKVLAASGLFDALQEVLIEVVKLTGLPSALIYLYDDTTHRLRVAASTGMSADFVAAVDHIQLGEGFSGRVFLTGEPIITENVSEDWRLSRAIVRTSSLRSYACIPLPGQGRVLGTLGIIGPEQHQFEHHEVEFLVSIGRQIGSLLEMAERAYGSWSKAPLLNSEAPERIHVTDRQASIIRLLMVGFSPKQIAIRMQISEKTVRNHISNAYAKAGVKDRGHLLLWAVTHGLVRVGEESTVLETLPHVPQQFRPPPPSL
jgi:DNA-binding CsgD family transcriptional regulator/putative methionine-R-sulfoxide reductase with GAF domain